MRHTFFGLMALISIFYLLPQIQAADYDLLLKGGKIMDGTGNPWFYGDVALRSNKIIAVARELSGTADRVINVSGLVVAPGFIDIHSPSDWVILEDGDAQSKIRQGVTTDIIGEGYRIKS